MFSAHRPGEDLISARLHGAKIESALGRDCVVLADAGAGYVKLLRRGSAAGRFNLHSHNLSCEDIVNVRIVRAAPIVLIRRAG
jgi:hypothetical protein